MCKEYLPYLIALSFLMLLHSIAAASGSLPAPDNVDSPTALIQGTVDQLLVRLESDTDSASDSSERLYALVNDVVVPHLDMPRIARIVLGKYARRVDADELAAFTQEFQTLLVRTYATSLKAYSGEKIDVLPAKRSGNGTASVRTNVHRQGAAPIVISFLAHNKMGPWLVYDIRIEGISLVTNFRSEFAAILGNSSFEKLMNQLKSRNRRPQLAAK
jgi:phospholipid transport system substrate-binding protein